MKIVKIKLPVTRDYFERYRTEDNMAAAIVAAYIDKNEKEAVLQAQKYLDDYAEGKRTSYATDIDFLLMRLYPSGNS